METKSFEEESFFIGTQFCNILTVQEKGQVRRSTDLGTWIKQNADTEGEWSKIKVLIFHGKIENILYLLSLNDIEFIEFNSIKNQELANRDKVRKEESVSIISSGNYTTCEEEFFS